MVRSNYQFDTDYIWEKKLSQKFGDLRFIEMIWNPPKLMICFNFNSNLTYPRRLISCQYLEFVIISDRKAISSLLHHSLSGLEFIFNHFFLASKFYKHPDRVLGISVCELRFQISQKLHHYVMDLLNKPIISWNCIFPLSNPYSAESLYFVPSIESLKATDIIVYLFLTPKMSALLTAM